MGYTATANYGRRFVTAVSIRVVRVLFGHRGIRACGEGNVLGKRKMAWLRRVARGFWDG